MEDLLLDYERDRSRYGRVAGATHAAVRRHPLCGDEVEISLRIQDGAIAAIGWEGRGCLLFRAATALLCEFAENRAVEELSAPQLNEEFPPFVSSLSPSKRLCATLSLTALQAALQTTESGARNDGPALGSPRP